MDAPFTLWRGRADAAAPFTVCAFFTFSHRGKAARLQESLDAAGQAYALFETPRIHRSVSLAGSDDMDVAKPSFIAFALAHCGGPVLYVDADMVFRGAPSFAPGDADFAVYNWLADEENDGWLPAPEQRPPPPGKAARFWKFYFSVDVASADQLFAMGGVQYWTHSAAARALLAGWRDVVARDPAIQDDHALDQAFNRMRPSGLKARWLPKDHARCAFWPYVKPVIEHPGLTGVRADSQSLGLARADPARLVMPAAKVMTFPREGLLDLEHGILLMPLPGGGHHAVARLPRPLYPSTEI